MTRIGVVGLDNAVVVASDEAVLVTTRDKAETVKALMSAIEEAPEKVISDFIRHSPGASTRRSTSAPAAR